MRELVDLQSFGSGFKAFIWAGYCLKIDNLRRELIPGYDPKNLTEEEQQKDLDNFEKYYEAKYGNSN